MFKRFATCILAHLQLLQMKQKTTLNIVGADLWSPAVVGVVFYYTKPTECNKPTNREAIYIDFKNY